MSLASDEAFRGVDVLVGLIRATRVVEASRKVEQHLPWQAGSGKSRLAGKIQPEGKAREGGMAKVEQCVAWTLHAIRSGLSLSAVAMAPTIASHEAAMCRAAPTRSRGRQMFQR